MLATPPDNHPKWGIASMVSEPLPLLYCFVAHHLDHGAHEIQLFMEGGADEAQAAFAGISNVHVQDCAAPGFWAPREARPEILVIRQRHVAKTALTRMEAEWMLFCDGDEFVADGRALERDLAGLDARVEEMRLPVRERVHIAPPAGEHIFEGQFRRPMRNGHAAPKVFGENANYLIDGLTAHRLGKTLYRRGLHAAPGVHWGTPEEGAAPKETRCTMAPTARLYHFDGMTPLNWGLKLRSRSLGPVPQGRASHPSRIAQIRFAKGSTLSGCVDLYHRLSCPAPERVAIMDRRGLILRDSFDPRPAVRKYFPNVALADALRPKDYDTLLRERSKALLDPPLYRRLAHRLRERFR